MIHPPRKEFAQRSVTELDQSALYDARELTQGEATAHITLDDKVYTLRITRAGKLILTK